MRMTPDGAPTEEQRELAKKMDAECFEKARKRGEQTFTVVEHDVTAPRTILFWIMENFANVPPEKLRDAFEDALARQHSKVTKRYAD
jgi:hypothetical protein